MTGQPVILIVLDGWGINLSKEGNAVSAARAPIYDSLLKNHPIPGCMPRVNTWVSRRDRWETPRWDT